MEDIRRFLHTLYGLVEKGTRIRGILGCFLGGLFLNIVIELMDRQSLSAVFVLLESHPLAFLENVLILTFSLSLCLFSKRRWFFGILIGTVWLGLGIANLYVLSYRVSPLSAIDFAILQLDWSFIGIYMSVPAFILLVIAVILLLAGLVMLFKKCPKSPVHRLFNTAVSVILLCACIVIPYLPTSLGFGENTYTDVIRLTENYGFAYTFTRSLVDTGIDRPEDYSARRVRAIAAEVLRTKDKAPEDVPNIIFLQLESFFDVNRLKDVMFSENPVPYFEELKETCPSGYFTAPSVGAGTANTEFEVITQMNVQDFGTGEYPYKTILQETPCESIAYDLKKLGLASHVIHNNTATFYDRNIVFPKLGFDSFTTLEYMNHVETNEIGWAKDKILTKEIVRALSETEERDLIYTISVQPHGAYPVESETADIKVLSGIEDPALRGQMEYYATQIHEVDEFLRTLTDVLTTWEEPTVLVLYGDHMPSLEISKDMLDLSAGGLFETEYVIWSNCGVGGADRNVKAYQLSSRVLELLDINVGTLTKFHQLNPWREIASVYGAPADCLWGGGRLGDGEHDPRTVLSLMREYNISARLTFSNSLLEEKHLSDPKCNTLCKLFAEIESPQNGVIVHSDLLLDYLKKTYPGLYFVSSTTKVLTDFEDFKRELEREDFRFVVPDFRLNKQVEKLNALPQALKDKAEFLCNECCSFGCKDRKACYEAVSRKNLGIDGLEHICTAPNAKEGYRFSKAMENPGFIGVEDIQNVYLPMGFTNFKIEGRGLGSALILEFLLYYMTKPEYRLRVREEIYLENMLDLF